MNNKDENVTAGIIGGLLSGFFILFIFCIALFCGVLSRAAQIGIGSFIAFGYIKFSKSLSGKGMLICTIIAAIYSHIAFKTHMAFLLMKTAVDNPDTMKQIGFFEAYGSSKELFESVDRMSDYYGIWLKIGGTTLLFSILGVFAVYSMYKKKENK